MDVKNFVTELDQVNEYWSPRIVGQVNDQYVKVAKLSGRFVWHKHDHEDEMFYIIKGRLVMEYEDRKVQLNAGDFHIVPKNTLHNPVADQECHIVLIEPVATRHTGDVKSEMTKSIDDQLGH